MRSHELHELARLYSIQLSYEDATGKRQSASRDALVALLKARSGIDDLDEALRARRAELDSRIVEPVVVAWGHRAVFDIRLPNDLDHGEYDLTLESGDRFAGRIATGRATEYHGLPTRRVVLPHELPFGYHTFCLKIDGRTHETLVIAAPPNAPAPTRSWGVFLPLYAVRTARTRGLGDLADLAAYRRWVNSLGGGIVATLPMLAAFPDEPSPYSPVSRLFWNELYLDLEALPEYRDDVHVAELEAIASKEQVDYVRANAAKRRALERMAARFEPDPEFERFAPRAADYAEFRAHHERDLRATDGEHPVGTQRYHLYVQYRMAQQMRAVADEARRSGPGLYLDFPLGVNPAGYDVWRHRDHFAKGVSVGAPPDAFFTKGQNWGFPPLDPDAIRTHGHNYLRACVRHHVQHAGILRIDHVMGLHRLFWIPQGAEPADGIYVRYPHEELYAALLIEANRTGTAIVGEDLGTVPEYVPIAMSRHGLRQMYALQYELKPQGSEPAGRPPAASIASINTHDMPPFAAFWRGDDIEDRLERGLLDERGAEDARRTRARMREALTAFLTARGLLDGHPGDRLDGEAVIPVLKALLAWLGSGDAEMVLVNLEDLWLEHEPQNVPGVPERSWRHKLRLALEDARDDETVTQILRTLDEQRRMGDGDTQKADERSGTERRRQRRSETDERRTEGGGREERRR